jgi:hypothetical protein
MLPLLPVTRPQEGLDSSGVNGDNREDNSDAKKSLDIFAEIRFYWPSALLPIYSA